MAFGCQAPSFSVDLGTVIDNLPSAVIVVDRDRRVLLANRQAANLARRAKSDFFGLRGGEAFGCVNAAAAPEGCGHAPECEYCRVRRAVAATFETRRGRIGEEAELTLGGSGRVLLHISTNFIAADRLELVILAIEDVSEQRLQDQIRLENARLRAATATAAAVCHEMSQPLMAMSGFVSLLLDEGDDDAQTRELVRAVQDQAGRLGTITRRLMSLKSFQTKPYAAGHEILDLDQSSGVCG